MPDILPAEVIFGTPKADLKELPIGSVGELAPVEALDRGGRRTCGGRKPKEGGSDLDISMISAS